jgi:hypothetical protein
VNAEAAARAPDVCSVDENPPGGNHGTVEETSGARVRSRRDGRFPHVRPPRSITRAHIRLRTPPGLGRVITDPLRDALPLRARYWPITADPARRRAG